MTQIIREIKELGGVTTMAANGQFLYHFTFPSLDNEKHTIMVPVSFLNLTKPLNISIDDGVFGSTIFIEYDYVDPYDDVEFKITYIVYEDGSSSYSYQNIRIFDYGYPAPVPDGVSEATFQIDKKMVLLPYNSTEILKRIFDFIRFKHRTAYESMLGNNGTKNH